MRATTTKNVSAESKMTVRAKPSVSGAAPGAIAAAHAARGAPGPPARPRGAGVGPARGGKTEAHETCVPRPERDAEKG